MGGDTICNATCKTWRVCKECLQSAAGSGTPRAASTLCLGDPAGLPAAQDMPQPTSRAQCGGHPLTTGSACMPGEHEGGELKLPMSAQGAMRATSSVVPTGSVTKAEAAAGVAMQMH
jgi:hypothetical protein